MHALKMYCSLGIQKHGREMAEISKPLHQWSNGLAISERR